MNIIELNLPVKNENLYTHYIGDNKFDYQYTIQNREIVDVWKSKKAPHTYILPQLNYIEDDQDLLKFPLEFCNKILSIKTTNPKTIKLQQRIVSKMLQGKLSINHDTFCEDDRTINVVAPSNSSVRFEEDSFGQNTKVNLILPNEMRLYEVIGEDYTSPAYIIAHKMIYGHQIPGFKITETSNINTENLQLSIDSVRKYDLSSNSVIEYTKNHEGTPIK